jgi:Zn-dependent protease with chaperone function
VSISGTGVYFDGATSRRQDVHVAVAAAVAIVAPDGRRLAAWPFDDLREIDGFPDGMRLTREGGPPLARLEIRDAALADEIRRLSPKLRARRAAERGVQRKVVLWSLAAVVSAVLFGLYGVPALADRVAPLLPWGVDQRMGAVADAQIRFVLPVRDGGFECGAKPDEAAGRAALDVLAKRLSDGAALPVPIKVVAVRSDMVNALALPGGTIYLFDGLIQRADSPDELAGVLAHEIGHVASRDGARRMLQAGGMSFLFGFVLGDFVGGGAAVTAVRALSEASYSRVAEADADRYSVALMRRIEADPKALGSLFARLDGGEAGDDGSVLDYLASHPAAGERRRAIDAAAGDGPRKPLLDGPAFEALKGICGPIAE